MAIRGQQEQAQRVQYEKEQQQKRDAERAQIQAIDAMRPADIQYISAVGQDPNSVLGAGLLSNTQLDARAHERLREDALRRGPSAWRALMEKEQAQRQAIAQDQLAQQQMGQRASAMNALAMRGGLRSGSAERLAQANMAQGLLGRQGIARQGAQNAMGYDIQDVQNQREDIKSLLAADFQKGNFDAQQQQFNIQNSLREIQNKREFESNMYNQKMQAWAAQRTAQAAPQESGGK